jgi:phosphoglycerate dehydrogenase-like enzyme
MPVLLLALNQNQLPDGVLEEVKTLAEGYTVIVTTDKIEIRNHLADLEIAVGGFPRELLTEAPKLQWFQQWGAGADWLRHEPEVRERDFILTNASGVHPVQISEHIFALLLGFARGLPSAYQAQKERRWLPRKEEAVFELEGKTMLLVGVGAIGERTAHLARAFGMHVVGVKRNPSQKVAGIETMVALEDLGRVLSAADVIVLTVPLTDETYHFLGEKELTLMKDESVIINIGRGGTIDEVALLGALEAGKFRGVGLDVFEDEPLPKDSPLWTQERVVITAHYAGASPRYHERAFQIFLDNLRHYLDGKDLVNVVDKRLGY